MGKLMFFVVVALGLGLTGYPDDKENSLANFPGDFAGHWALDMPSGWIDVTRQGDVIGAVVGLSMSVVMWLIG